MRQDRDGCGFVGTRLRALVDGELKAGERRRVLAHLDRCAACRDARLRVEAIAALVKQQPLDEPPPHLSTELQLRLSRHRRSGLPIARPPRAARPPLLRLLRPALVGVPALVLLLALGAVVLTPRPLSAEEVVRRAERRWLEIQNYGCEFVSQGIYQGQQRTFVQKQFYRRPGEFRLDTAKDYRLTTYVTQDRVVHYLPGGSWKGRGPLVIIRPRRQGRDVLPFPFGVTWSAGGNISLDHLVRRLSESLHVTLAGSERMGGHHYYRLQFEEPRPGSRRTDRYDVWIDRESYLPRVVFWYRDPNNQILTTARDLHVNYAVLPSGTFDFPQPEHALVIHGDVDPHVFALPIRKEARVSWPKDAAADAEAEIASRAGALPFVPVAPRWLPDGFEFLRVRGKRGRWVETYWARRGADGVVSVLQLVQQDAGDPLGIIPAEWPTAEAHGPAAALPYRLAVLTWDQDGSRMALTGAGLTDDELLRIGRSLQPARADEQIAAARLRASADRLQADASVLPAESLAIPDMAPESAPTAGSGVPPVAPPMMPEMADPDAAMMR